MLTLRLLYRRLRDRLAYARWKKNDRQGSPPHAYKQEVILAMARTHRLKTLVETGTYLGEMISATRHAFDRIVSIELSESLHLQASRRFRGDNRVQLVHGDSADALAPVLATLKEPALFWLDGHYSAGITARGARETPIVQELEQILASPRLPHVILIDDAGVFGRDPEYPSIAEVESFVRARGAVEQFTVEHDITASSWAEAASPDVHQVLCEGGAGMNRGGLLRPRLACVNRWALR